VVARNSRFFAGGSVRSALVVVVLGLASIFCSAQESFLHADFRREGERFADACKGFNIKAVPGCAIELFTDHPLHMAAGSMPPQNGFGLGAAFVTARNTPNWRMSWDVDAVGAFSGAWRAGGYMKLVHTPRETIHVTTPTAAGSEEHAVRASTPTLAVHPYTIFNLYAQAISLNKLNYFGLGNDTQLAGASVFGMTQTIVGGNVIKPVFEWAAIRKMNLSLQGEVNGRFANIRGENGQSVPTIQSLYTNATAPGLSSQPGFAQLGEGIRIKPGLFGDHLQLNYLANFQQFFAPSDSHFSFLRWTVDLGHSIPLYGHTQSAVSKDSNGPDECAPPAGSAKCPDISYSRNLNGSIGVRLFISESINSASSVVPFYFQQTLGGADINGAMALGSYQDYRFRAPNVLLLQESFEHSIWGPFGLKFMADEGRVALTRGDLGFSHLRHSFAGGFTLRAGGFPMVSIMFAWGGPEGHHNIFNMNSSLLGGSARPLLD
jgi:hypothetical protein